MRSKHSVLNPLALLQVPPNYDSLLGKLIVWGEDRTQAIARMKRALNELVISGVPTTTQYHEMILEIEDFVNGNVDTGFIPKHADQLTDPPPPKTSVSANACYTPSAVRVSIDIILATEFPWYRPYDSSTLVQKAFCERGCCF